MAKVKKAFFCKTAGSKPRNGWDAAPRAANGTRSPRRSSPASSFVGDRGGPLPAGGSPSAEDIRESAASPRSREAAEVNRVLGGGMVPGSLVLVGGEPGIGKSTLSLQIALAANGLKTLYVSGEESAEQIKMRAARIGIGNSTVPRSIPKRCWKTSWRRSPSTVPTWW